MTTTTHPPLTTDGKYMSTEAARRKAAPALALNEGPYIATAAFRRIADLIAARNASTLLGPRAVAKDVAELAYLAGVAVDEGKLTMTEARRGAAFFARVTVPSTSIWRMTYEERIAAMELAQAFVELVVSASPEDLRQLIAELPAA